MKDEVCITPSSLMNAHLQSEHKQKKMNRSGITKNKGAKRQDKARFVFFPQLAVRQ